MIKVVHLITGLDTGGAEMTLFKLVSNLDRSTFQNVVVSMTTAGAVGGRIEGLGIPVYALGMRPGVPDPRGILRFRRLVRTERPQVVQTWMYHADLLGGLAARLAGGLPVAWNIRHTNLGLRKNKLSTVLTAKACAWLSRRLPDRIVSCSEASKRVHVAFGYDGDRMVVIPNGFDLGVFKPDKEAGPAVRRELCIPEEAVLIGFAARYDPQKDHRNFVAAAAILAARAPSARFLLCGQGVTWENRELAGWIDEAGVRDRFYLLGKREDMPRLTAALDIASTSSCGEGFPNVIGEAMACGVPSVGTDVGDTALLIGGTGRVVPPDNPAALADGWQGLVSMGEQGRRRLGMEARRRIEEFFSLPAAVARYEGLYKELSADG